MTDTTEVSEYKSQLAEIETLLQEAPDDEALIKLKSDLMELIQLSLEGAGIDDGIPNERDEEVPKDDSKPSADQIPTTTTTTRHDSSSPSTDTQRPPSEPATTTTTTQPRTKKSKPSSSPSSSSKTNALLNATFEIPPDLLPLPSDTDAVRTKKRRKIKALKSSFRSKQKSAESEVKQQSWLEFTTGGGKGAPGGKKKKKRKKGLGGEIGSNSIFRTEDGIGAKVGVISGTVSVKGLQRDGRHGNVGSGGGMKRSRHTF